jgi:hypothetical protein
VKRGFSDDIILSNECSQKFILSFFSSSSQPINYLVR